MPMMIRLIKKKSIERKNEIRPLSFGNIQSVLVFGAISINATEIARNHWAKRIHIRKISSRSL